MRKRTRSRELALQMLYQLDAHDEQAAALMDEFLEREEPDNADVQAFTRELVNGTLEARTEIDGLLTEAAENWRIDRMALVDRNIMRMAIFEMLHLDTVPAKVTINEAIELGKRFSTKQSGSFINGILDRIRRERDL